MVRFKFPKISVLFIKAQVVNYNEDGSHNFTRPIYKTRIKTYLHFILFSFAFLI